MPNNALRVLSLGAAAALCCGLAAGCVVAADALNPNFFSGLGVDPQAISGAPGRVVIALTNSTTFPVQMSFIRLDQAGIGSEETVEVEAGGTVGRSVECPAGTLAPGSLDDNGQATGAGAATVMGDMATELAYGGAPLASGVDFECGDVVEIDVQQNGAAFAIVVRVLAGR